MTLQAVIFDMDGVLTATVEFHYQSWKKAIAPYDIPFTRQDNEKLLGLTRRRSLEVILGNRYFSEEQMQEMLEHKNNYYLEYIQSLNQDNLLPGVQRLIDELQPAKICIGVASGSRNAGLVLERLGIASDINIIYDGSTVQHSKPAPVIFLKTAEALKVKTSDCIVIEDSQAGILAAQAAGMCTIGLGPDSRLQHAQAVYTNLSQVNLKLLQAIYDLWKGTKPMVWNKPSRPEGGKWAIGRLAKKVPGTSESGGKIDFNNEFNG